MRITNIALTKKGRYSIYGDDEYICVLHEDVFFSQNIIIGMEMEYDHLMELQSLSEGKITRDRAFKLLSARSYTAKGLYNKLLQYGQPEVCQQTVHRMEELGLINDVDYAHAFARDLYNLRGFSKIRIITELVQKGIDRDLAKEATEQFDWQEDISRIEEILEKKYRGKLDDPKERNRAYQYLARQGFSYGDIKTAISRCSDQWDEY